jgi:hypothetical protein
MQRQSERDRQPCPLVAEPAGTIRRLHNKFMWREKGGGGERKRVIKSPSSHILSLSFDGIYLTLGTTANNQIFKSTNIHFKEMNIGTCCSFLF